MDRNLRLDGIRSRNSAARGHPLALNAGPAAYSTSSTNLYFSRFVRSDPFAVTPAQASGHTSLLTDEDFPPKKDLVRTEFYNEFMGLLDVHAIALLRFRRQGSVITSIHINRSAGARPFEYRHLNSLRQLAPYLSRAFEMGRKVGALDAARRDAAELLTVFGTVSSSSTASAACGSQSQGRANPSPTYDLARGWGPPVCPTIGLGKTAERIDRRGGAGAPVGASAVAIPTPNSHWPLSVTVSPLSRRHATIFGNPGLVLVCVTDLEAQAELVEDRIRILFGLTPAEARLAGAIFDGLTQTGAAGQLEVTVQTARNQLKRIFERTGVNRQADLVRLLIHSVPPLHITFDTQPDSLASSVSTQK